MLEASPCIVEMGALFECWATAGVNDSRCTAVAQSLTNCMQKPVSCASQKTGRRGLLKNFFFLLIGNQNKAYKYNQLPFSKIKQTIVTYLKVYHI